MQECSAAQICAFRSNDPTYDAFAVDKSYQYYLNNWYSEMDLMCLSAAKIGFLITAYYIGFAIGGLCFTFPDTYGRKKSLIFGLILATISQTVMIVSHDYWVRFAMFGLSGLS